MPAVAPSPWARQGFRFVIVGLAQLLLDWAVYVALTGLGADTAWANPLSRFSAMLLGFWAHGRYTFADEAGARLGWRRLARFLPTWLALTALGTIVLAWLADLRGLSAAWLAKPAVEAVLAVLSFLALRAWVYRR
ncbi:GtrA family protein [Arenimonas fontis]|uniref:GtrA family protein n=1 Tax=Arenimonas fontis TaxID=2608255 RepID=A0A5B2Z647_9GAMM|nr:GtrA family protein [Arenimonas fontis]KAA2283275.1 GtrA family protein [Arenimonas fontis]